MEPRHIAPHRKPDIVNILRSLPASSSSPTPLAGRLPAIASSPRTSHDSIERPTAEPLPNPYRICPDPSRDRYPQTVAIGLGVGALAPVLPAIVEGGSLDALGAIAAARVGPVARATVGFAKAALQKYAAEAAPLTRSFATRDTAAQALGSQAWKATEETLRSAVVGAGFTAGAALMHGAMDIVIHGRERHHPR